MEAKERDYQHQIEVINLQHEKEIKKNQDEAINQLTANAISGAVGNMFSKGSQISDMLNDAMSDALKKRFKH